MTKFEANAILNQVREGVLHPPSVIIKALTITGDIHDKCSSLDSATHTRLSPDDSPYMPDIALQSVVGEQT